MCSLSSNKETGSCKLLSQKICPANVNNVYPQNEKPIMQSYFFSPPNTDSLAAKVQFSKMFSLSNDIFCYFINQLVTNSLFFSFNLLSVTANFHLMSFCYLVKKIIEILPCCLSQILVSCMPSILYKPVSKIPLLDK